MAWLSLPINTGAYIIAHCGGSFDFKMVLRNFLSDEVLRMKKVEAPLKTFLDIERKAKSCVLLVQLVNGAHSFEA